jgi:hypothetical protein
VYHNDSAVSGTGVSDRAKPAGEVAKEGAQEVTGTAKEQGREVAREARDQARSVASDLRGSVTGQARTQNQRLAGGLRQAADQFHKMGPGDDSPADQVVRRLGDGGRRAADYLENRGPEGLLEDVQGFARRKPGTFLLAAAVAGFVIGRFGRAVMSTQSSGSTGSGVPGPDAYPEGEGLYRSATATETFAPPVPAAPVYDQPPAYSEQPGYPSAPAYPEPVARPAYDEPPLNQPGGPR